MSAPIRVQLSRAKGWRMPPNTVKVDRTTRLGNPFTVTTKMKPGAVIRGGYFAVPTAEEAVACFREMLTLPGEQADGFRAAIQALRGENVACWCKLGDPCHGDVILELANLPADGAGYGTASTTDSSQSPGRSPIPTLKDKQ